MVLSRKALRNFLFLLFGACLYTLAAPPYEWSSAAWIALAPLFLVIRDQTPRGAFFAGLLYGVLFCIGIAPWVYVAIATYFPFPFPAALLFTFLSYSFFVGSYTGVAASLSCALMRSGRSLLCRLGIPALWVGGEYARSSMFSGFSWELLGYTQYRHLSLIQIADLTGVYGVSFLLALSGYVAAEVWTNLQNSSRFQVPGSTSEVRSPQSPRPSQFPVRSTQSETSSTRNLELGILHSDPGPWTLGLGPPPSLARLPWSAFVVLTVCVSIVLGYGAFCLTESPSPRVAPTVRIALIQGKVPQAQRWKRVHYASTLFRYATLTRHGTANTQPDLVVWPEFAVGFYLDREPPLYGQLGQLTKALDVPLLLGAPRVEKTRTGERYYNSAYLLAPGGTVLDVYDKIRLLPFAEYRPLALPSLVPHPPEHPGDFTAGSRSTIFSLPQGKFGVLICYEATYPSLARHLARGGAQFLVNISNDTWLAGEAAAAQHFSMAVFRAVENRRPLARVATAGIAGFVDPLGRVSQLSAATENAVLGDIIPRQHLSVYTRYGDWFVVACGVWALGALLLTRCPRQGTYSFVNGTNREAHGPLSFPFVVGQQPDRKERDAVETNAL